MKHTAHKIIRLLTLLHLPPGISDQRLAFLQVSLLASFA
jgi:hypothetical protein